MLPYVTKEEFQDIGTKLLDYGPQMGGDFLQVGQEMLTPEIRRELIGLQGFEFSFRGNQEFEPWRVKAMEEMVHRQIQAILRGGGCRRRMCLCRRQRMHLPNRQRAGKRLSLTMGRNFWRQNSWLAGSGKWKVSLL